MKKYNNITMKITTISDLTLDIRSLMILPSIKISTDSLSNVKIEFGEMNTAVITGTFDTFWKILSIDKIENSESYNRFAHDRLKEILQFSKGIFEATIIYKHEVKITKLTVHDGIIKEIVTDI
jgi:hypothetical protein